MKSYIHRSKNAMNHITVSVIRSLQELEEYKDSWNILALQSPQRSPMNSWAWLSAYFEMCLHETESWFCIIAENSNSLLGVLPVIMTPAKITGIPCPILRTPGDNHTIAVDLVVVDKYADQIIPLLIKTALSEVPSCRYLEFSQIVKQSPTRQWLMNNADKVQIISECIGVGAYLKTDTSFDDFRANLSANFRSNLNKARNKFKKFPEPQTEFKIGTSDDNSDLFRMAEVEDKSWKGLAGTSILQSQKLVDFYSIVCQRLTERNWLEWHFLSTGKTTIAANMAINFAGSIVVWKLGYDEAYKKSSPGSILFENLIQRCCQKDEIDELNLMTDMKWYDNWKMEKRKYYRIRVYSRHLLSFLLAYMPMKLKLIFRDTPFLRSLYSILKKCRGMS